MFSNFSEKPLNYNQQIYSVEEHHDDFSLRVPNDPLNYSHLCITIPDEQLQNSKLTEEANLLIASHSNSSSAINTHPQNARNFFLL